MFHTGVTFSLGVIPQDERGRVCVHVSSPGRSSPWPFESSGLKSRFHSALAVGFLPRLTSGLLVDASGKKKKKKSTFHLLTTEASGGDKRRSTFSTSRCHYAWKQQRRSRFIFEKTNVLTKLTLRRSGMTSWCLSSSVCVTGRVEGKRPLSERWQLCRGETFGSGEEGPNQINAFQRILRLHTLHGPRVSSWHNKGSEMKSCSSPWISSTWSLNGPTKQQRHATHLLQMGPEPRKSNEH